MVVCCSFACIVLYCLSEVSTIMSTISGDGHVSKLLLVGGLAKGFRFGSLPKIFLSR